MRPKPLVLVVDDERSLVLIAERVLQKEGFDVITAYNGVEGLKKAQESLPDIIVLDIVMPEMNGYEVCRKLQTNLNTCGIPVIFLSVKGNVDEKKGATIEGLKEINEAFNRGASDFLNKPVTARELIDTIKKALSFNQLLRSG
jgi:two-component system alkaline phosphatase synthesis response regulator PhoP